MKKIALLPTFIFCISVLLSGQDDDFYSLDGSDTKNKKEKSVSEVLSKWNFGGNFWMNFGTKFSYVEASPVALYRVSPRFMVGPGITYRYIKTTLYNYYYRKNEQIKYHAFGPRVVTNFTVFQNIRDYIPINIGNIIAYSEYELLNIKKYDYDDFGDIVHHGRGWINNWLIGGGIYQPFGERGGGIFILALYDVTQNKYSPYANPDIRIGFYF